MKRGAAAFLVWASACAGTSSTASDAAVAVVPDAGRLCERMDAGGACVQPCAEGNERKVGEFCTAGGGECDDNSQAASGAALICTVDFSPGDVAFCTKPCQEDSQCGSAAFCRGDPGVDGGNKGCVPNSCL